MKPKISTPLSLVLDVVFGIALASILALMVEAPVADSITAGLVLTIVLILIDMRGSQVQ